MLVTHRPLKCAQQPTLEDTSRLMTERQQVTSYVRPLSNELVSIPKPAQLIVSLPPIRADHGARLDGLLHCSFEIRCGRIGNSPKSNPTDSSAIYLRSDQNQRFFRSAPSPLSGLFASDIRFIDLDDSGKAIEAWSDHGTSEFVQPRPRSAIAAQPKHPLKSQCIRTVLVACYMPDRAKTHAQRLFRVLENGTRSHRGLKSAAGTFIQSVSPGPSVIVTATGTSEPIGPSKHCQVISTVPFRAEPFLKLQQSSRIILHDEEHYILWSPETSAYPGIYQFIGACHGTL